MDFYIVSILGQLLDLSPVQRCAPPPSVGASSTSSGVPDLYPAVGDRPGQQHQAVAVSLQPVAGVVVPVSQVLAPGVHPLGNRSDRPSISYTKMGSM